MSDFLAWHLPGRSLAPGEVLAHSPDGDVLAPALAPADIAAAAAAAAAAAGRLRALAVDDVIAAIDRVARRFLDPGDPLRHEALRWLPYTTGYGVAMGQLVLDRMADDWTEPALRRLLRAEFRNHRALERFVPHSPGERVRALPPRLLLHILAGNVPGVGVTSLVRGLLIRAPAICKTARDEPVLPVLFARALAELRPDLADALAVSYWPGGAEALEAPALAAADLVVHYGAAQAIADLRRRARPDLPILEHGPRLSFGLVARERAHRRSVAADAARALATFDQQGCVSPHLIYVEQGGLAAAREFAALVAGQLERVAAELPRGRLTTPEAAAVQQLRATVEFRALAGEPAALWTGERLAWTVCYDPDPAFTASCLGRFLWIKPVAGLERVPELIVPSRAFLQTAGIAAPRRRAEALAELLARAGCTRITTLADMPFPPPTWHHDGRGPLRELVRWASWEHPPK